MAEIPVFQIHVDQDPAKDAKNAALDLHIVLQNPETAKKREGFWVLIVGDDDDAILYREKLR